MATKTATANQNTSVQNLTTSDIYECAGFVCTLNQNENFGTLSLAKGGTLVATAAAVRTLQCAFLVGTNSTDCIQMNTAASTLTITSTSSVTCGSNTFLNMNVAGANLIYNNTNSSTAGTSGTNNNLIKIGGNNCVLTVNGTVTGGNAAGVSNPCAAIGANGNLSGLLVTVNGAIIGGNGACGAIFSATTGGTLTLNGNCTGGTGSTSPAIYIASGSTVVGTLTGSSVGGSGTLTYGLDCQSSSSRVVVGKAIGNAYGPAQGTNSASAGISPVAGVRSLNQSDVRVYAIQYGVLGMSPTEGPVSLIVAASGNTASFPVAATGARDTLVDPTATLTLSASDLRSGVVVGSVTGTLAVPAANQVSAGVAVDNTTGTAVLTLANLNSQTGGTMTLVSGLSQTAANTIWNSTASTYTTTGTLGNAIQKIRQLLNV